MLNESLKEIDIAKPNEPKMQVSEYVGFHSIYFEHPFTEKYRFSWNNKGTPLITVLPNLRKLNLVNQIDLY